MLQNLKGDKTSVPGGLVKRQNLTVLSITSLCQVQLQSLSRTTGCALFYTEVPRAEDAKEMQYIEGF